MPQPRRGFHAFREGFSPHTPALHPHTPAPQGLPRPQDGLQPAPPSCHALRKGFSPHTPAPPPPPTHTPAPQGLPRPQKGLQPAHLPATLSGRALARTPPRLHRHPRTPQPGRGFHVLRKGFSPHTFLPRSQKGLQPAHLPATPSGRAYGL